MTVSQNGWPLLEYGDDRLRTFNIPCRNGLVKLTLRDGSAGFNIAHFLMWWSEELEDLTGSHPQDDWGFAPRPIRGSSTPSNHGSGTAADANATEHPLGVKGTLTEKEKNKIRKRLEIYDGCLRHGAFYSGRVDEMHVEINKDLKSCERVARKLMHSPRGKRLLNANPGLREVVLS